MIALTDSALAHLAISASRIAPSRRRRWLADFVRAVEKGAPMKPLATSTVPTRRWRARLAAGQALLRIRVDEDELATTLVTYGLIDFNRADDPGVLAQGVQRALVMLSDLSQRNDLLAARVRSQLILVLRK